VGRGSPQPNTNAALDLHESHDVTAQSMAEDVLSVGCHECPPDGCRNLESLQVAQGKPPSSDFPLMAKTKRGWYRSRNGMAILNGFFSSVTPPQASKEEDKARRQCARAAKMARTGLGRGIDNEFAPRLQLEG